MKKSLKFCKSKTGFTLVELVIVIAIVIILSVISVPIYRGYVDKSKMSEGYALLGAIFTAQKTYFSEHGNFYKTSEFYYTPYDPVLGVDARGNKYFTTFRNCGTYVITDHFWTCIPKPKELITNNFSFIQLRFYVTGGTSIYEYEHD